MTKHDDLSDTGDLIGRVRAPKGTAGYTFITSDNKEVKIGEFVYYHILDDTGEERKVMGRATARMSVREYPVSYLSMKEVTPEEILKVTGIKGHKPLFEVEVSILGYFDRVFRFINPRVPPIQGTEVYIATDSYLREVLGKGGREQGKALIGHLLSRSGNSVPISLDVGELVSKHIAVLAATGSGKSYAVGVLLEELMGQYNRAAVLVLDPHGEYSTMDEMRNWNDNPLVGSGYVPHVQILSDKDIKFRYSDIEIVEWGTILKGASDKMMNLLSGAIRNLKREGYSRGERGRFDTLDIIAELETMRDQHNASSIDGIIWRMRAHGQKRIFSKGEYTPLRDLLEPGQLTIIDMSELEEGDQQLIASILLRRILRARIRTKKEQETGDEYYLPYPVFVVLEEAHRFAPGSGDSRAKKVLKTILSEGRKFGVGTCLVTQRPGKLDSDVLSQCMTQLIMKIINPADQDNIKQSVEAITSDLMGELPSLTTGQAIVVGAAINTPVSIRVRERYTTPGGSSMNAPREWREFHNTLGRAELHEQSPTIRKRERELF